MNDMLRRMMSYYRLKKSQRQIAQSMTRGETELAFGPSSLNLMMIDTCNAQCLMCGKDYRTCGSNAHLSLEAIRRIYDHLDMQGIVDVVYGGGGEPFLNPDLAAIAAMTRQRFPVIQHTVISNFISFKEEAVRTMLQHGVNFLISVNAATPDKYRTITGIDQFAGVIDHIRRLTALRRELKSRSHVALSMILMRQNIDDLPAFIRLAAELGADEVKTLYVRIYPESYRSKQGRSNQLQEEDSLYYHQKLANEKVIEAEKLAKSSGIVFDHEALFANTVEKTRDCCEAWKSLFINFNGDVYPCPASEILFKPKVDAGQYRSGNILEQHWQEFWNNPFWQAVRSSNLGAKGKDIVPECHCCGNAINWSGSCSRQAHILDWEVAEKSTFKI
jgi:radical SAM protein with 4Fe4S-binding SPASM domain